MKKINLKYGLVALMGLGLSANVSAADFTCSDITFSPEAFEAYEFIDAACLDMVERNGGVYAKLTARVVAQTSSGTHFRYRHADGELGPNNKADMNASFNTAIDGQAVKLADVAVRSDVNVYIPEAFWGPSAAYLAALEEEIVEELVEEAIVEELIEEAIYEEMVEEELEAELPTTASALPWLALFGSLFLVLGGALRFSRK